MTDIINSLSQESQNYINDASDYLKKINEGKYKFQIKNNELRYNDNGQEKIINDIYQISNILAKMMCDDYYCTINMPDEEYGDIKFSSGTEDDVKIQNLNQSRKPREAHGSTHVYGATMFVNEMLNELNFNPELTMKDKIIAIICTLMHDSCRKGEKVDKWDKDSAILATKLLEHFGMDTEEDKEYLKEIMTYVGDKDGSGGWKIEGNDTEKQKKAKIIATVVDLGDTEEILRARTDSFNMDLFFKKIKKIEDNILNYSQEKKQELAKSLAKHHYILSETVGIGTNRITCENQILKDIYLNEVKKISGKKELKVATKRKNGNLKTQDIIFERSKIIFENPKLSEEFEEYKNLSTEKKLELYLYEQAKPLTENNKKFINLRNENIYLLLSSCNLIDSIKDSEIKQITVNNTFETLKNREEIIDYYHVTNYINKETITYTFLKIQINDKNYILMETLYNDRKVSNFDDSKRYKEFKIFKDNGIDLNILDETKLVNVDYPFKNNLQEIDNTDLQNFFSVIPYKLIEKEKEFQLKRLKRLYPFINGLFDEELSSDIKNKLEISIINLFDNNLSIQEKFKYKEQLASILKLIKISYKGNKKYTDHFLMLNNICEAKTENELSNAIQYILRYTALREFYKERTKLIPLKYSDNNLETNEKYIDKTIFRGIGIRDTDKFDIEQAFKRTANLNTKLFDFYHTIGYPGDWTDWEGKTLEHYISLDEYHARKTSQMSGTRGNITAYSTDPASCIKHYVKSGGAGGRIDSETNFLFAIQPNKDLHNIFGKVDGAAEVQCGHDYEVNTPDVEISDVAFALKFEKNKVTDVIFNKNFNGEFYINGKLVSKNKLKAQIIEISQDIKKLSEFFSKNFRMERLVDKYININEVNDKHKLNKIPSEFQNIIKENINNSELVGLLDELLYIYNNSTEEKKQNIIKSLNDFKDKKKATQELISEVKDSLLQDYIKIENYYKIIEYYKDYLIRTEQYNISDINKIIMEKGGNDINLLIKLIEKQYKETGKFDNNVLYAILCNKSCNNIILNNIGKILKCDINIKNLLKNNYNHLLTCDVNNDVLMKFFELFTKEELSSNNMDILTKIAEHKNSNLDIYKKILEICNYLSIIYNNQQYKYLLKTVLINSIYSNNCNNKDIDNFVSNISSSEILEEQHIEANNIIYNSIFELFLNHNCASFNYNIDTDIIKKLDKNDLLTKRKITITKFLIFKFICETPLEAILNHEKCTSSIINNIINKFNAKDLIDIKTNFNNKEYSIIGAIFNHTSCDKTIINNIINKLDVKDLIDTKINFNNKEYSIIGAIFNHTSCDKTIINNIINKFDVKDLIDTKINFNNKEYSIIETVLYNKNINNDLILNIVNKLSKEDLLKSNKNQESLYEIILNKIKIPNRYNYRYTTSLGKIVSAINEKGISIDENFLRKKNKDKIIKVKIDNEKEVVGYIHYSKNEELDDMKKLENISDFDEEKYNDDLIQLLDKYGNKVAHKILNKIDINSCLYEKLENKLVNNALIDSKTIVLLTEKISMFNQDNIDKIFNKIELLDNLKLDYLEKISNNISDNINEINKDKADNFLKKVNKKIKILKQKKEENSIIAKINSTDFDRNKENILEEFHNIKILSKVIDNLKNDYTQQIIQNIKKGQNLQNIEKNMEDKEKILNVLYEQIDILFKNKVVQGKEDKYKIIIDKTNQIKNTWENIKNKVRNKQNNDLNDLLQLFEDFIDKDTISL